MNSISSQRPKNFAPNLDDWWQNNKREFPWRSTKVPYEILIAEVLLHRTRAEQVAPIYLKFIDSFPTIGSLAEANLGEIQAILHGLGLNWRIELLHKMAQEIENKHNGKIPENKDDLKSLPGVSDYIASAVMCFAFNRSEPLLDTNIVRVIGRVFALRVTDSSRRSSNFKKLYIAIGCKKNPRNFAFAIIDLGALVCLPSKPLCNACPVRDMCSYFILGDR
jgi:A/G-specific adenine glycosylase